jgi:undecaprenyl-diphosphatase
MILEAGHATDGHPAPARRDGDLLRHPRRSLAVSCLLAALVAALALLVRIEPTAPPGLGRIDASWRDLVSDAPSWMHGLSEALKLLGSGAVMVPLRVGVAIWLLLRRRRWDAAAWLLGWAVADLIAIGLKPMVGRPHPGGLGASSFPSAHAKTAAQVAIGLVLVTTNPWRRRIVPWALALTWIAAMSVSRTVLHEHWLSDVVAGSLLGAASAVGVAAWLQRRRDRRYAEEGSVRPDRK